MKRLCIGCAGMRWQLAKMFKGDVVVNLKRRKNMTNKLTIMMVATVIAAASGCQGAGQKLAAMNPFRKSPSQMLAEKKAKAQEASADPLRLDHKVEVNAEVFVANGRLWESTGNSEKAMENYTKALQKEPNNAEALGNIARIQFREGNYPKANEFFSKACAQKPEDAGLQNDLGLTLSKMGRQEEAVKALSNALSLSPGKSRYANNLASVKYEMGDREGAFGILNTGNKPSVANFNMAFLAQKHGHLQDAKRYLEASIENSGNLRDGATKQAIQRSREMLAKLNGPAETSQNIAANKPSPKTGTQLKVQPVSARINSKVDTSTPPSSTLPAPAKPQMTAGEAAAAPPSGPFVMPPGV